MEKLTSKEKQAQENFLKELKIKERKTEKPIVIAIIGLTGSGQTLVAKKIAKLIGGTIIEADKIRIHLRQLGEHFEGTRKIAENIALKIIKKGGNPVFDSDFIDSKKRIGLKEKIKGAGAKLIFVRTYCDRDVMIGRIITGKYLARKDDFFGGAGMKSSFQDTAQTQGATVKLREMWRRTPNHYCWDCKNGGNWILKRLPFNAIEIDTTDEAKWLEQVKKEFAKF